MSTVRFNTQFPGYEVLSELGRSNARVLKARHLATGDLVAIKHFALNTDAETLRRFQRESEIMTGISHPNIVRIREVQLAAELPYIVMELIEGGSLRHLLAGLGNLDVPTTTRLGLQLASAFNAFHPQGIVHRDIKPENILYRHLSSGELHFLLTDFGVARLHEQSNTMTGQSLMTYEYASPEQFSDPRNVGVATDYYSLGVVLFECLTGAVPFALSDQSGIVTFMNRVLNDTPPALTLTPGGQSIGQFAGVVQGLLAKKAVDRISAPDELTWRLKQAELDYLQAGRTNPPASRNALAASVGASSVTANATSSSPINLPVQAVKPVSGSSSDSLKVIALALLVVLSGLGIYYFARQSSSLTTTKPTQQAASNNPFITSDSGSLTTEEERPDVDSVQIRLAAEARRQEQLRQQILSAISTLDVEVLNYKVGFIGGIENARLKLNNPSSIAFSAIKVQVRYYKEKGGLYKTESVFFMNVRPYSSPVHSAPDSDRGTRIDCKILAQTAAPTQTFFEPSTPPDPSIDSTPTDPLN